MRLAGVLIGIPLILFSVVLLIVYINQDKIIQSEVDALNKGHKGQVFIGDTHLEPFKNFPYISIKVDDVRVLESKQKGSQEILNVADIYLGFNIWDIIEGNYDIQKLLIEDGFFNVVFHKDGSINLQNAFATSDQVGSEEPMDIHLKKIELKNIPGIKSLTMEFKNRKGLEPENKGYKALESRKAGDLTYLGDILKSRDHYKAAIIEYQKALSESSSHSPVYVFVSNSAVYFLPKGSHVKVPGPLGNPFLNTPINFIL